MTGPRVKKSLVSIRSLSVGIAIIATLGIALPAAGAAIPLPHLRPPYKAGATASRPSTDAANLAAPQPIVLHFNANSPFTREQQAALANITAYFNSFTLMEGRFTQIGPHGEQSEGVFFLNRPGRIRFHYRPPARLDVISDGSSVAIKDGRSNTQDLYPLSKTPLRYLLAGHIDLTSPGIVSSVKQDTDLISLVIVDKTAFANSKLTMIFDRKTYELRKWIVTDAQGLNTTVAISNLTMGKAQDPGLFRISVQ